MEEQNLCWMQTIDPPPGSHGLPLLPLIDMLNKNKAITARENAWEHNCRAAVGFGSGRKDPCGHLPQLAWICKDASACPHQTQPYLLPGPSPKGLIPPSRPRPACPLLP